MLSKKKHFKIEDIPNEEQEMQDLSKNKLLTASIYGGSASNTCFYEASYDGGVCSVDQGEHYDD